MIWPEPLQRIAPLVNARLEALFDEECARWSEVDQDLAAPFAALRDYVLAGGKRLRPAFCFWAFVGAGGDPADPAVVDAGAALEMLHTAALVHDDIIDGSVRRHDTDTVHVRFDAVHRAQGWSGSAGRFGDAAAIVIGDLALVYSSRLLINAPAAAQEVFEEMRLEVNVGQYLDILGAAQGLDGPPERTAARAGRICQYKTAKYTIERPLHLGAALAAPGELGALAGPLSEFGLPLGEAFQLRDDLLGVFGDPAVTGKPVGDDLREGKPTLLASLAASGAKADDRAVLVNRLGAADLSDEEVAALQAIVAGSGAREKVEDAIQALVARAEAGRRKLPLGPEAVAALGLMAEFVAGRDH